MEQEQAQDSYYVKAKRAKAEARKFKPPKKKYIYSIPKLNLRVYSENSIDQVKKQYEATYHWYGELEVLPVKK